MPIHLTRTLIPQRPSERTDAAIEAALLADQRAVTLLTHREEFRFKDFIVNTVFGDPLIPRPLQYARASYIKSPSLREAVVERWFPYIRDEVAKLRPTFPLAAHPGDVMFLTERDAYAHAGDLAKLTQTHACGFMGVPFQTAAHAEVFYKVDQRFDLIPTHLQTEGMCYSAIDQDPANFQYIGAVKAGMIDLLIATYGWTAALQWIPRDLDLDQVVDLEDGMKDRILGGWDEVDKIRKAVADAEDKARNDALRNVLAEVLAPTVSAERLAELLPPGVKLVRTRVPPGQATWRCGEEKCKEDDDVQGINDLQ